MSYDLNKYKISTLDLINLSQEIPVDSDITLPDYCPDIGKILKCCTSIGVLSRNLSGDRLNVEGITCLELLYTDFDKNIVRCFKTEIPFSCNFNIKSSSQLESASFNIKKEYLNCRAVSSRRIDIHGAFILKANVFGKKDFEITTDISGDDIKQKKIDVPFSQLVSTIQRQINLNEVLDLGSEKAPPEFIIKSNASINDLSLSIENEKINIKGKSSIKILYMTDIETGKLDSIEYDIPINENIDAPDISDDCFCTIIPELLFRDEKIPSDSENSGNLINEDMKIMITLLIFQNDESKVITDIYSTEYEIEESNENISFQKFLGMSTDDIPYKESLDVSEGKVFKILDIWEDCISCNASNKSSGLSLDIKFKICILFIDPEFIPYYIERDLSFSKDLTDDNDKICNSYIFASIPQINYKLINDDNIELKFNIQVNSSPYESTQIKTISEVMANEANPKNRESDTALTVYYASSGESLWDIAKFYGTTIEKIKDENDIDFDVLESDQAILIPTINC